MYVSLTHPHDLVTPNDGSLCEPPSTPTRNEPAASILTGIDFDDFRDQPLRPEALRSLRYMHDVEHHTVCYLRDLLLTPAHQDPEITSFLSCWVFEEMWHGEAIGQVLGGP